MTTAKEILELIEAVDPNDTAKLDEIDARVFCLLLGTIYISEDSDKDAIFHVAHDGKRSWVQRYRVPKYTRSRDALKAVRPNGWFFYMSHKEGAVSYSAWRLGSDGFVAPYHPQYEGKTEELSELHVIVQCLEYDRTNT